MPLATLALIGVGLAAFGVAFAISPLPIVVVIVGLAFAAAVIAWPLWGYAAVLLIQLTVPLYIALPLVPALPALPLSFIVFVVTATIVFSFTKPVQRDRPHPIAIVFAAYGAALALSILLSSAPTSSINPFVRCFVVPFTAYLMTRRVIRSPADAILPLDTLLVGAVIASLYGVVEYGIRWNPLIEKLTDPDSGDMMYWMQSVSRASTNVYRSFSLEMNPLFFGTVVSMLIPYAVARFAMATTRLEKVLFGAAAAICSAGVVTPVSRGPLLAVVGAVIVLAVVFVRVRRTVASAFIVCLLAGLATLPWLGPAILARVTETDNVSLRFKLWQIAWHMFLDDPITGVGLNGFAYRQLAVLRTYEIGPFPEYFGGELEKIATADNTFLQLAAETGILGVVSFAALFAVAAVTVSRNLKRQEPMTRLIMGSIAAAASAYLINGLTINAYTAYTPTIIMSVLFALTASIDDSVKHPVRARIPRDELPSANILASPH